MSPPRAGAAYAVLTLSAFFWAGNAVASKWAAGQVSPQVITTLRWVIACLALAPLARRDVAADWPVLRRHWLSILAMGTFGYTAFNSLFYAAGSYTSALNLALFQGAIPIVVVLLNRAVLGVPVGAAQGLGVILTVTGATAAATHGDWGALARLDLNRGDLFLLVACVLYAGYTLALPRRPRVSGLAFFTAMAAAAFVSSLPPLAAEWAAGRTVWPTARGWALVTFVALGPSLVAQLCFMRGVEMIGPNRAGLFVNLVPVFGAVFAVLVVGEPFGPNDALALALVLGGIAVAEVFGPARRAA